MEGNGSGRITKEVNLAVGQERTLKIVMQPAAGVTAPTTSSSTSAAPASGTAQAPAAGGADVRIASFAFDQPTLTIGAGQTVTWANTDSVPHTITSDDGKWDSGTIQPGATFRRTFDQPGTYAYHCSMHPYMKATVVVKG